MSLIMGRLFFPFLRPAQQQGPLPSNDHSWPQVTTVPIHLNRDKTCYARLWTLSSLLTQIDASRPNDIFDRTPGTPEHPSSSTPKGRQSCAATWTSGPIRVKKQKKKAYTSSTGHQGPRNVGFIISWSEGRIPTPLELRTQIFRARKGSFLSFENRKKKTSS